MGRALHDPPELRADLAAETGVIENAGAKVFKHMKLRS
jgi:hypothetical protein